MSISELMTVLWQPVQASLLKIRLKLVGIPSISTSLERLKRLATPSIVSPMTSIFSRSISPKPRL